MTAITNSRHDARSPTSVRASIGVDAPRPEAGGQAGGREPSRVCGRSRVQIVNLFVCMKTLVQLLLQSRVCSPPGAHILPDVIGLPYLRVIPTLCKHSCATTIPALQCRCYWKEKLSLVTELTTHRVREAQIHAAWCSGSPRLKWSYRSSATPAMRFRSLAETLSRVMDRGSSHVKRRPHEMFTQSCNASMLDCAAQHFHTCSSARPIDTNRPALFRGR